MSGSAYDRGLAAYRLQRWKLAAAELRNALAEKPNDPDTLGLLALSMSEAGERGAIEVGQQAVAAAPDYGFAHYALAWAMAYGPNGARYKEAQPIAEEAIRLLPSRPGYYRLLAGIQFDQGNHAGAVATAERGLAIDPTHFGCAEIRSHAMLRLGQHAEAEEAAREVLALNPDDHRGHAMRGRSLLKLDRPHEAAEHLREALRLNPGDQEIISNLVEAMRVRNATLRAMLRWLLRKGATHTIGTVAFLIGLYVTIGMDDVLRMLGVVAMAGGGLLLLTSYAVQPLANALVVLDPLGRRLLTPRERFDAALLATGIVYAIIFLIASLAIWPGEGVPRTLPLLAVMPAVGNALASEHARPRWLWWTAAALLLVGAVAWMICYARLGFEVCAVSLTAVVAIGVLAYRWRGPFKLSPP